MKFDTPETANAIDRLRVVGRSTPRVDGPLKTTGTAPYAHEHHEVAPNATHGFIVTAGVAKGRLRGIDTRAARSSAGVLAIVTAENAGRLGKGERNAARLLAGPDIDHYHQAVAIVVADTFENARAAAGLVRVDVDAAAGNYDLAGTRAQGKPIKENKITGPSDTHVGDFDEAFAAAPVKLDEAYTTPDQSHAMMEPHATIAAWNGHKLTVWTSTQMVDWNRTDLAKTLGISKDDVRIVSPFVGGGFGGKLFLRADALLAALAARAARRPVKLALTRPQIINNTTHRPATYQRIRIGATRDGFIQAIAHESWSGNLPGGSPETAVNQTRLLYAGQHRMSAMRQVELDLPEGNSMRAPGEAPGLMALEIAMDEMAERLGIDPIEFRVLNDTQVDPENPKRPFSQRRLIECMRLGAERFGWNARDPKPAQRRDGDWLIGIGMAAAFRNHMPMKSAARVTLDARGQALVETDMTDIGTGSYTVLAQTAAEALGLGLDKVEVRLGDSRFPVSCGSGGQFGGTNSASGVFAACMKLRGKIAEAAGLPSDNAEFADGHVSSGDRRVPLAEVAAKGNISAEDTIEYGSLDKRFQQSTFGAHFVEVGVDVYTGETRVRRMLAVCAAGRILNPLSARSQVIGAMTMGVGAALTEKLDIDMRQGFFVNHDLSGYEVPVHADIPHQDVVFLDETDPISSPMKSKGIAELGICGVAAAVANAVYNATGVRVRDYPLTLDKLLDRLPT